MLTHEEAAFLRSLQPDPELEQDLFGWGFTSYNLPDGSPCKPRLEEDGKAALAEYDAHHVIVSRWQLERALQLLSENLLDEGAEIKALRAALEAR